MRNLFNGGKWYEYVLCGLLIAVPFLAIIWNM